MAGGGWVGWGDWVPRREPTVRVVTDRTLTPRSSDRASKPRPPSTAGTRTRPAG